MAFLIELIVHTTDRCAGFYGLSYWPYRSSIIDSCADDYSLSYRTYSSLPNRQHCAAACVSLCSKLKKLCAGAIFSHCYLIYSCAGACESLAYQTVILFIGNSSNAGTVIIFLSTQPSFKGTHHAPFSASSSSMLEHASLFLVASMYFYNIDALLAPNVSKLDQSVRLLHNGTYRDYYVLRTA
jgi:hypothetical protein